MTSIGFGSLINRRIIVTTGRNPDMDGVACALGYAELLTSVEGKRADAVLVGDIAPEGVLLSDLAGIDLSKTCERVPVDCEVVLVDTHHVHHLHHLPAFHQVIEIIDHHPDGDVKEFPQAFIQNERVGAAATLICERWMATGRRPSRGIALLLAGGVFSNTLGFRAPSTHTRDIAAFEWLKSLSDWSDGIGLLMRNATADNFQSNPDSALWADIKLFVKGGRQFRISQVEVATLFEIMPPRAMFDKFSKYQHQNPDFIVILNAVDVTSGRSAIFCCDTATRRYLSRALKVPFADWLELERVCQRKTDIIPFLENPSAPAGDGSKS